MKRVTQPQLPNFDVDGYGMQQQVYIEQDDDDSPSRKKKSEPRSCLSYVVLAFLFFSALYGMASLSGAPITDSAAAMARQKFQSFESSLAHFPLQSAGVAPAIPPQPSILENPADKIEHVIPVVLAKLIPPPIPSAEDILADLHKQVKAQEDIVRAIKQKGTVMEEDEQAKIETGKLQDLCRQYVPMKYGPGPYYLKFDLVFPDTMPDFETAGSDGSFVVQMGPVQHVPYSVFFFLEMVGENWKGGAFHRPAHHVLQALVRGKSKPLAFQEYSPEFPHVQFTLGYAGRPGGPAFYVSTVDNSQNHGPASQGSRTEADGCWGRLAGGETSLQTIKRIQKQPGGQPPSMFTGEKDFVRIPQVSLLLNPTPLQQEVVASSSKKLRGAQ